MRTIALLSLLCACGTAPAPEPDHRGDTPHPGRVELPLEPPSPVAPDPEPAPVPAPTASWQGVYFDPVFGYLHLVIDGDEVKGRWLRAAKDRMGTLAGVATGDRLDFEWEEHLIGVVGPTSTKKGRGHFVYKKAPDDTSDDELDGDLEGAPWHAIKQRNMMPDIESSPDLPGEEWDPE